MAEYTLYNYWRSSSSWRVRLALEHKGLSYKYVPVHLVADGGKQHAEVFVEKNPMRQVPLLEIAGAGDDAPSFLAQSVAIMEYLEEAHPERSIFPEGAYLRARTRQLVEIINAGTQPLQNLAVIQHLRDELEQDAPTWCRRYIERGLGAYQASLAGVSGRFSVGDEPSAADFCLIPQLYNARRFKLDLEPFAKLLEIEAACAELDAFERAHPDAQPDAVAPA